MLRTLIRNNNKSKEDKEELQENDYQFGKRIRGIWIVGM